MKNILILVLACVIVSCNKEVPSKMEETKIDRALKLARKNKEELQKVLTYYNKETDSLKHKAAHFLIENMIGLEHNQITPEKKWKRLLVVSDSLIEKKVNDTIYQSYIDSLYISGNFKVSKSYDLETITSEELIKNIELAFKVWPKPWNDYLSFDDFCNLILPYKSQSGQYDIDFRESYYEENIEKMLDTTISDEEKRKIKYTPNTKHTYLGVLPFRLTPRSLKRRHLDCIDNSNFRGSKYRAIGIPMYLDCNIDANGGGFHYLNSFIYNDTIKKRGFHLKRPKVKRYSFKIIDSSKIDLDTIPKDAKHLYDPHLIDVTDKYHETISFTVPLESPDSLLGKTAYLCVFNRLKWTPIALSSIKKGNNVTFKNIAKDDIIYTLFLKERKNMFPISQAFTINEKGDVHFYKPNLTNVEAVTLRRKFKNKSHLRSYQGNAIGNTVELSNSPNFWSSVRIFKIKDTLKAPISIDFKVAKQYRYARFKSLNRKIVYLSELHFYSDEKKLTPRVFFHDTVYNKYAKHIVDNDLLSSHYLYSKEGKPNAWVGCDFKEPVTITNFFMALQSDLNYIESGNLYELFYWDMGWISVNQKVASNYYIDFENVPKDAVLWLRNLSKGKEEDLFLYKNGKQVFWSVRKEN